MSEKTEYMNLAWKMAIDMINLSDEDRNKIFGYSDVGRIIKNNSSNVVGFKIFQYKSNLEEEKINIGDIVKCDYLSIGVVINIIFCGDDEEDIEKYNVLFVDGTTRIYTRNKLEKTNRSVDILHILEKLILQ